MDLINTGLIKEAGHKRTHTAPFHLNGMAKMNKSTETENTSECCNSPRKDHSCQHSETEAGETTVSYAWDRERRGRVETSAYLPRVMKMSPN